MFRNDGTPLRWLQDFWSRVENASQDRSDVVRTPTLATVGPTGPEVRMVVLRQVLPDTSQMVVYTDAASNKVSQISFDPRVQLCFWDPHLRIQMRASGVAQRAHESERDRVWSSMSQASRSSYDRMPPPGTEIASPGDVTGSEENRLVIYKLTINETDILRLDRMGHWRCQAVQVDGQWNAHWVSP